MRGRPLLFRFCRILPRRRRRRAGQVEVEFHAGRQADCNEPRALGQRSAESTGHHLTQQSTNLLVASARIGKRLLAVQYNYCNFLSNGSHRMT